MAHCLHILNDNSSMARCLQIQITEHRDTLASGTLWILSESFANLVNKLCWNRMGIKLFFIPRSQKIFVKLMDLEWKICWHAKQNFSKSQFKFSLFWYINASEDVFKQVLNKMYTKMPKLYKRIKNVLEVVLWKSFFELLGLHEDLIWMLFVIFKKEIKPFHQKLVLCWTASGVIFYVSLIRNVLSESLIKI